MIRARPLLGTQVEIRVEDPDEDAANGAIDRGFAAIAEIHRLMSFHEPDSDVSRLNRAAAGKAVAVSPLTFDGLARAREVSEASGGAFDITIADRLVAWGYLPRPDKTDPPAPGACWRDVVLESAAHVRFARPLWIDLGGIAKGFAVDRALAAIAASPSTQVCVNAGGDLRVAGPRAETVRLRTTLPMVSVPAIEIGDGALASSSGREHARRVGAATVGPHVNPLDGTSMGIDGIVSVAAPECATADALTKVVLAGGAGSERVLGRFGAIAYLYEPAVGWRTLGA